MYPLGLLILGSMFEVWNTTHNSRVISVMMPVSRNIALHPTTPFHLLMKSATIIGPITPATLPESYDSGDIYDKSNIYDKKF